MFIMHYSCTSQAISIHQKKPCFHLELDPALQAEKDIRTSSSDNVVTGKGYFLKSFVNNVS
jgi:hypothetical protein